MVLVPLTLGQDGSEPSDVDESEVDDTQDPNWDPGSEIDEEMDAEVKRQANGRDVFHII